MSPQLRRLRATQTDSARGDSAPHFRGFGGVAGARHAALSKVPCASRGGAGSWGVRNPDVRLSATRSPLGTRATMVSDGEGRAGRDPGRGLGTLGLANTGQMESSFRTGWNLVGR